MRVVGRRPVVLAEANRVHVDVDMAVDQVVIAHAGGLHEGVDNGWTHEGEAGLFKRSRHGAGFGSRGPRTLIGQKELER